jgi:hypothetical protein
MKFDESSNKVIVGLKVLCNRHSERARRVEESIFNGFLRSVPTCRDFGRNDIFALLQDCFLISTLRDLTTEFKGLNYVKLNGEGHEE